MGYIIFAFGFAIGLFGICYWNDYLRKIISFAIFSSSSIMLFVTIAYKYNSYVPIHNLSNPDDAIYTDPIPSVLMLTAIVVGISVQAIALSLYLSFAGRVQGDLIS